MLRTRPCGEIIAAFGHELERKIGSNAMDPGQILSKQGMECFRGIESKPVRLSAPAPRRSRTICPGILLAPSNRTEFLENRLDPGVTSGDLLLIHIIERQRLLQDKHMLCPIMAGQSLLDHLRVGMATRVAH